MKKSELNYLVFFTILLIILPTILVGEVIAAPNYTTVTIGEAKSMVDSVSNLYILDVRTQEEFDEGHIVGARLIPYDEIEARQEELTQNKGQQILVYCRTGRRSAIAVVSLESLGYTALYNMDNGFNAWVEAGYPFIVTSEEASTGTSEVASQTSSNDNTPEEGSNDIVPLIGLALVLLLGVVGGGFLYIRNRGDNISSDPSGDQETHSAKQESELSALKEMVGPTTPNTPKKKRTKGRRR